MSTHGAGHIDQRSLADIVRGVGWGGALAKSEDDQYHDYMTRTMTITEVKAKLLSVITDVEHGDEIEITRRGVIVARISPARGPLALKDMFAGVVTSNASDEELFSTGERWNAQ